MDAITIQEIQDWERSFVNSWYVLCAGDKRYQYRLRNNVRRWGARTVTYSVPYGSEGSETDIREPL